MSVAHIREALPGDAQGVTELLQGIYREGGYFVGDRAAPAASLRARLSGDGRDRSLYLVAMVPDQRGRETLAGWLELHRGAVRRLEHVATLTLAVAAGFRRLGLARGLLRRAYAWCAEVGVLKVSLNVRAGNEAAIALYLSEGFEFEGRERAAVLLEGHDAREAAEWLTSPAFEDNLLMAKFLSGLGGEHALRVGR